ncbi:MAG: carbamoyltransferase HypF, partial [Elusimicrobia bacterium]|nr:carbamoyltransferase HypF [Elusimicrobiota bacterium]
MTSARTTPTTTSHGGSARTPACRVRVRIHGAVQGVGFRPFVHRLARSLKLTGWVSNGVEGVAIEAEGPEAALKDLLLRLEKDKPPRAAIYSFEAAWLDPAGYEDFRIRESDPGGAKTAIVMPDIATCPQCLRELLDPSDRRFRYPFINCTDCGPRFSIIEGLPYDRPKTTMRGFPMCPRCRAEYEDPDTRRFHAQPNACPACGPHLELWSPEGGVLASREEALSSACEALRAGSIVALKGIGGFQLLVHARREEAVQELRRRKRRDEKPFALLFPTLAAVRGACEVSPAEERLLSSPEAPIVLLRRKGSDGVAQAVAPHNPLLGVMLPYSPLHHLLMTELGFPVVATSGNLAEEPICIDNHEALSRLRKIADVFLVHDRPIARPVDDSVARVVLDRELLLRRARGYAPLPVPLPRTAWATLAVGGHLKNTVALSPAGSGEAFLSQHVGDLATQEAFGAFERAIASLKGLYDCEPARVVCDLHPDYRSTRFAEASGLPLLRVQHHQAHVYACMADNGLGPPAAGEPALLGVAWDGTGWGPDGTVWGGEFFTVRHDGIERAAHWRRFRLPGGERAVREPRRSVLGLLYEIFGEALFGRTDLKPLAAFTASEREVLRGMLAKGVNAPRTSSVGRLFDAVAALAGLRAVNAYEGQAAMELEHCRPSTEQEGSYPIGLAPCRESHGG